MNNTGLMFEVNRLSSMEKLQKENKVLSNKLDKIEQIIKKWNDDIQMSQKDLWMYLADIKEILENE